MQSRRTDFLWRFVNQGSLASDSDEIRLKKAILTLIAFLIAILAVFWGALYIYSGYTVSGMIPLTYAGISLSSILYFFLTKKFEFFRFSQFFMILILPFLLMWSLGGFANSSAVIIWAFFSPLAAIFFHDLKAAFRWLVAYTGLIAFSGLVDPLVSTGIAPMSQNLNIAYFVMNLGTGFLLVFIVIYYFVKDREAANVATVNAKEEALNAKDELEKAYEQLQNKEQEIRELMHTDFLTGLPNRRFMDEKLEEEMIRLKRYGHPLSLIMSDLDYFKRINDAYGHTKGDELLVKFARLLVRDLRPMDCATRFGGEEFLIILPETNLECAAVIAERIRQQVEKLQLEDVNEKVSASFGVTQIMASDSAIEAVGRVDQALYQSKERGRNCVSKR